MASEDKAGAGWKTRRLRARACVCVLDCRVSGDTGVGRFSCTNLRTAGLLRPGSGQLPVVTAGTGVSCQPVTD